MILNFEYSMSCGAGHAPQLIHLPDNTLKLVYLDDEGHVMGSQNAPYLGLYDDLYFPVGVRYSPDEDVTRPSLKKVAHYGGYGFWSAEGDHKFVIYMMPSDISDALVDGSTQFSTGSESASLNCNLLNIRGKLINRYRSILTPGTMLELYVALGNSGYLCMGVYYIDRASVSYPEEKVSVSARDAVGKLLKEQTFDEGILYNEGTLQDNIKAILDYAGVSAYFVGDAGTDEPLEFEPDTTILEGLKYAIALLAGWKIAETAEGVVGIASADDVRFDQPARYTFQRDRQCWNYSVDYDDADGASRVRVFSMPEDGGDQYEQAYVNVGYNPWWAQPGHRTLHYKTVDGASHAQVQEAAEQLAAILRESGRLETFAGIFTPQLTLGDEVQVIDHHGAAEIVGAVTDVTHSFGRSGFITSFTTDSGGRKGRARLKDLINSATDKPVSFTGVKPSGDVTVGFMNSSTAEVSSGTSITGNLVMVASNLVLAFVAHRSAIGITPEGWTLLHTTEGFTDGSVTQYLSIFYRFTTDASVSGTFTQASSGRMYLNMIALSHAGTPRIIQAENVVATQTIPVMRPSSDEKVVWAFHRGLWTTASGGAKWQASGVAEENLVQLNVAQLLQLGVDGGVGDTVDGEEHMEFGPCGLSVFYLHMVAAVVNRKGHVRECRRDILRRLPVSRIVGVVVVAVHGQAVAADEVAGVPVAVPVLGADVVVAHGLGQRVGVGHIDRVGIEAVALHPNAVGMECIDMWNRKLREANIEQVLPSNRNKDALAALEETA